MPALLRAILLVRLLPMGQKLEETGKFDIAAEITRVTEGGSLVEPDWYEIEA